jgi:hypothetical protein
MSSLPTTGAKPVNRQKNSDAEPHFKYVKSLERGLAIIAAFNEEHPQLTLADVGRATGLDRSTTRRFLLTLKALGYVEQNDRYFFLAPRTLQLGYRYLASLPWWRGAQVISERLTSKIGASSAVGVLDHDRHRVRSLCLGWSFSIPDEPLGGNLLACDRYCDGSRAARGIGRR